VRLVAGTSIRKGKSRLTGNSSVPRRKSSYEKEAAYKTRYPLILQCSIAMRRTGFYWNIRSIRTGDYSLLIIQYSLRRSRTAGDLVGWAMNGFEIEITTLTDPLLDHVRLMCNDMVR
jgi:hypothetical protein